MPTAGVVTRDTPGVSVSKKKAPTKVDRGKGMDLLSKAALLEDASLKKTLKKSKQEIHKLHASGSGDGVGSQPKVPDEQQDKTSGTKERTDNDRNDDDSGDLSNDDDDDVDSDAGGDNEVSDSEKTNSDKDENPKYEELYKDVNVRLKDAKHEEERKGDAKMTDAGRDDGTQQTTYEQVKDDEHLFCLGKGALSTQTSGLFCTTAENYKSQILTMVDAQLSTRLEDSIKKTFRSFTTEFEKKAQEERKRYIDLVEKSVKDIIKDKVKSQLP
nr:hypothetical protein [Tanacetum cinerariifolium]